MPHIHTRTIYYDDTDFTGVVYHANYLKYCEHAREHLVGVPELVRMWKEDAAGFAVYEAHVRYRSPARHGDNIEVRTVIKAAGPWRTVFQQDVHKVGEDKPLVECEIHLVCLDKEGRLSRMPLALGPRLLAACGQTETPPDP
jgi:acyl-CoA thioester hydrolase